MVTLISCHPYVLGGGPYRYIVYCERAEDRNVDEAVAESSNLDKNISENGQSDISNVVSSEDDNLLEWETKLRTMLPALTLLLAGVIIFIRSIRDKKHKEDN